LAEFSLVPKQAAKVLILKKNQKNKLEDVLLQTTNITERSSNSTKLEKPLENMTIVTQTTRHPRNYSIEEFIPIRKNTTRK